MPKGKNKKPSEPKPIGRPSIKYTPELGKRICDEVSISPNGLERICRENEWMPGKTTIKKWKRLHPEFAAMFVQARLIQAEEMLDENIDILQDLIEESNLRQVSMVQFLIVKELVSEVKWRASKILPKQYGDSPDAGEQDNKNKNIVINFNKLPPKKECEKK